MLSFFEMCQLLEARAKRKTAKDALADAGAATPAAVEPPQYSKENPHPSYGQQTTHASGEVVDTPTGRMWRAYTPEEKARKEEKLKRQTPDLGQMQSSSAAQQKQREEAQRKKSLQDYQIAWTAFEVKLKELQSQGKNQEEIEGELGLEFQNLNKAAFRVDPKATYDSIADAISDTSVQDPNPFTGGEDAKASSQLSKKEMEKIHREEEARRKASETQMGATGDITQRSAEYAADLVMMWNDWLKGRAYRVFTKMAIKDLGIKVDGPAVVSGALERDSDEYFKIALYGSRGEKSGADEVIMTPKDFLKIKSYVEKYVGQARSNNDDPELSVTFKQALAFGLDDDLDLEPKVVQRAIKFEKALFDDRIVDRETTIGELAGMLADVTGSDMVGGLEQPEDNESVNIQAVGYMIGVAKTGKRVKDAPIVSAKRALGARNFAGNKATIVTAAGPVTRANAGISDKDGPEMGRRYQRKFDYFDVEPGADLFNPNTKVRVRPPEEVTKFEDPDIDDPAMQKRVNTARGIGRAIDVQRRLLGGGSTPKPQLPEPPRKPVDFSDAPSLESTDLSDLMTVLEYWNK